MQCNFSNFSSQHVGCRQFERQYVFVAATLPSEGKKSIANDLRRMFPELVWLAGNRLHQGLSTVTWAWREITQETWKTALQVLPTILCTARGCWIAAWGAYMTVDMVQGDAALG